MIFLLFSSFAKRRYQLKRLEEKKSMRSRLWPSLSFIDHLLFFSWRITCSDSISLATSIWQHFVLIAAEFILRTTRLSDQVLWAPFFDLADYERISFLLLLPMLILIGIKDEFFVLHTTSVNPRLMGSIHADSMKFFISLEILINTLWFIDW